MQTQAQYGRLDEALDLAALNGLLRWQIGGRLTHVPFALSPCQVTSTELQRMELLTTPFSETMLRISRDRDFLLEQLQPLARTDGFLKILLDLDQAEDTQSLQLLIQRNDFFLTTEEASTQTLRQVELNTIASSFPFLMERLIGMHRMYFREDRKVLRRLVDNAPLKPVVDSMAEAIRLYGKPEACMLTVIQHCESNRFDQLGIEQPLWEDHSISSLRRTFCEIAKTGSLQDGHLRIDGCTVALVYYRGGYTPDDFSTPEAIEGRRLIEASSAIQIPDLLMQLAGMKKIQHALTGSEVLRRYAPPDQLQEMASTFVAMHSPDELIETMVGHRTAMQMALEHPENWVLKPQREGGGNNYFDAELLTVLNGMSMEERANYVLMERIRPRMHQAILVVEGQAEKLECVSEIGRYGVLLADTGELLSNKDCGYLVRTKSAKVDEGGVCAGFSCLNTLMVEEKDTA